MEGFLWPLGYKERSIPEDLGEDLAMAGASLERRHIPCLVKLAAAGGIRTTRDGHLVPGAASRLQRNLPGLCVSLSLYIYISHEMRGCLSGFSLAHHFREMWVVFPWCWLCSRFDRGKNSKGERKGVCGNGLLFMVHPALAQRLEANPRWSRETFACLCRRSCQGLRAGCTHCWCQWNIRKPR